MASTQAQLQASRDAQKKAQDLAWQEAQRLANEQKTSATQQAEQLAQEAFVSKKQQERVLPNVMAQSGLAGQGYTETTANAIGTSYQNAWNQVMKNKSSALSAVDSSLMGEQSKINQNKANIDAQYANDLANYQASLDKKKIEDKDEDKDKPKETGKYTDQAIKALSSFAWDPKQPDKAKADMSAYLQNFVAQGLMTKTQLDEAIRTFMNNYYLRTQTGTVNKNNLEGV